MKKYLFPLLACLGVHSANAQWLTNGTAIYNSNTGNVGIGTTTPDYPLTIIKNGNAWISFGTTKYPQIMVNGTNQPGGGLAISDDGGFFDWNDGYVTYEPLCCGTGLRISRSNFIVDNNVGIDTTNPGSYKLAVEGTIGARKVKVTTASWADYVFEKNYHLPTLAEVEKYIQQHKHLPDVPSAAEVEKNGLDLGDNQAILLKKIEELTLYMIEQNKQIIEQNKKIENQALLIQALKEECSLRVREK